MRPSEMLAMKCFNPLQIGESINRRDGRIGRVGPKFQSPSDRGVHQQSNRRSRRQIRLFVSIPFRSGSPSTAAIDMRSSIDVVFVSIPFRSGSPSTERLQLFRVAAARFNPLQIGESINSGISGGTVQSTLRGFNPLQIGESINSSLNRRSPLVRTRRFNPLQIGESINSHDPVSLPVHARPRFNPLQIGESINSLAFDAVVAQRPIRRFNPLQIGESINRAP